MNARKIALLVLLSIMIARPMAAQTVISNLSSAPSPTNALRQELTFNTAPASKALVEFGYFNGTDTIWLHTDVAGPATSHQITLAGLRSSTPYACRVKAFDVTGITGSANHTFVSGTFPFAAPALDSHLVSAALPKGYLLSSVDVGSGVRHAVLLDTSGAIIWYEPLPGGQGENTCLAFAFNSLLAEVALADCDSIRSLRFDGNGNKEFDLPFDQTWLDQASIHDRITFQDDRTFDVLVAAPDTITRNQAPFATEIVMTDALVRVDSANFSVIASYLGAEDPQDAAPPGGRWTSLYGPTACDWKDVQGFSFDFDGYPLLSAHSTHQIQKFDLPAQVSWTCGPGGVISIYPVDSLWFPSGILAPGDFTYYTYEQNRDSLANRLVKWYIDWSYIVPEFYRLWQRDIPVSYTSFSGGSVEPVPGGSVLTSSKQGGYLAVHDPNGNRQAFWAFDGNLDAAHWVDRLYPRPVFSLDTSATAVCVQDSAFDLGELGMTPTGGFWEGDYVANGNFDAASAGAGTHLTFYHYGLDSQEVVLSVSQSACGTNIAPANAQVLDFDLFPNPVAGENVQLRISGKTKDLTCTLYAADGKILFVNELDRGTQEFNSWELDTRDWPRGQMLYLHLSETGGRQAGRWVLKSAD